MLISSKNMPLTVPSDGSRKKNKKQKEEQKDR